MGLTDGHLTMTGKYALLKIEQGYKQEFIVKHLFLLFKEYCFAVTITPYIPNSGIRKGLFKS